MLIYRIKLNILLSYGSNSVASSVPPLTVHLVDQLAVASVSLYVLNEHLERSIGVRV